MNTPFIVDWKDENEARHVRRHGIPFAFATRVFFDRNRLDVADLRRPHDPPRFNAVGMIDNRCINVTYAMEGDLAVIISARPASRKERRSYAAHRTF